MARLSSAAKNATAGDAKVYNGHGQRLLNADEVAVLCGFSSGRAVLDRARLGTIPSIKLGRMVRFSPADLAQWIDANRRKAAG